MLWIQCNFVKRKSVAATKKNSKLESKIQQYYEILWKFWKTQLKIKEHISLIGAGLSGPVMASYLSSIGFSTDVYESRSDMRTNSTSAGRSINLALSVRGIKALKDIGVYEKITEDEDETTTDITSITEDDIDTESIASEIF